MKALVWLALASTATAIMLALSLPPVGWWPLAWVALAPLLVAVKGRGFFIGFVAGIATSLLVAWLAESGILYAPRSFVGEPTWTYLGCAMFGFVLALGAGAVGEAKDLNWRWVVWIAAAAVVVEFLLMPVIPATIALTQSRVPGMLTLASLAGIWSVAFCLWGFNLWLASAFHGRSRSAAALAPAFLLLVVLGAGYLPMSGRKAHMLRVAAVQSSSDDLATLASLSREGDPELAVWPEFGGMPFAHGGDTSVLRDLASQPGMPAIVTSFPDGHRPMPRNAASLFGKTGESERYFKRRLFGGEKNMHTAGTLPTAVDLPHAWGGTARVGLNICFDSCFPQLTRETAQLGEVGIIALPTIDPESPHGFLSSVHAAFTPFRAAELGVAMVRADAYAHSMIVANTGMVIGELPANQQGSLVRTVDVTPRWTLYKALGDWFLYACGLAVFGIGVTSLTQRIRHKKAPSE